MMRLHGWLVIAGLVLATGCRSRAVDTPTEPSKPATVVEPVSGLSILAWNIESGGSDTTIIIEQLKSLGDYDVIGLSEVHPTAIPLIEAAIDLEWNASTTGGGDRLMLGFNSDRFELVRTQELSDHEGHKLNDGNHRSPFFVHLKQRDSALEFLVMVNHLARAKPQVRQAQAAGLREWARDQSLPVICVGDFNFDFDFKTKRGNDSFAEFMRDGVWKWVKPEPLIDTNWSDNGKGADRYPDSMLDFSFTAQGATAWKSSCRVIERPNDFPDDETTSDHRPVVLKLDTRQ